MKRSLYKIVFTLLFALLAALGQSQTPQRIVSLAPSLTKMLYLINIQQNIVGCTSYCEEGIKDKKNVVASAVDVNVEKVFLLNPDLVIATSLTKPSTIEALKKVGIKVNVFPMPKSYNEICNQFIEIAQLAGKKVLATNIVAHQQQRLNLLKQSIPTGKKRKVFFEIGAKPLFTVIPNTFMNDFITYSGAVNIASELENGSISREFVLLKNPDFIFVVTMGVVGAEEKARWEENQNITASKNKDIYIIESHKACSPDPVNFVDVVEQLIIYMYK